MIAYYGQVATVDLPVADAGTGYATTAPALAPVVEVVSGYEAGPVSSWSATRARRVAAKARARIMREAQATYRTAPEKWSMKAKIAAAVVGYFALRGVLK